MNRYFALSCAFHLLLAVTVMLVLGAGKNSSKTTYTIDFIGSGKVVSMQQQQKAAAAPAVAPKTAEVKKEIAQPAPAPKAEEPQKTAKKAYKENISLKEACVALGFLTAERFDEVFHPEEMA